MLYPEVVNMDDEIGIFAQCFNLQFCGIYWIFVSDPSLELYIL